MIKGVFYKKKFIIYKVVLSIILNRSKDYYENNKERLRKQARDKYRNLSEKEKKKKREYGINRRRDMSEEKKQRLINIKKVIARLKSLNI